MGWDRDRASWTQRLASRVAGAYVRLGAHSGLKSDIARGPKTCTIGDIGRLAEMKEAAN